jgi:hypothetical protein
MQTVQWIVKGHKMGTIIIYALTQREKVMTHTIMLRVAGLHDANIARLKLQLLLWVHFPGVRLSSDGKLGTCISFRLVVISHYSKKLRRAKHFIICVQIRIWSRNSTRS